MTVRVVALELEFVVIEVEFEFEFVPFVPQAPPLQDVFALIPIILSSSKQSF